MPRTIERSEVESKFSIGTESEVRVTRTFPKIGYFIIPKKSIFCTVLQCAAACCSVLQCAAACCSALQCVAVCCNIAMWCSALQCVAVCCSVLQCVAA